MLIADIEGAETGVFNGTPLESIERILMEIHPHRIDDAGVRQIFRDLDELGFVYDITTSSGNVLGFHRAPAARVTKLFSLVVPAYNVAPYLHAVPRFARRPDVPGRGPRARLRRRRLDRPVAGLIAAWIASVAPSATLLRKENGGLSSARNAGLDHVTGTWVTFCDPDDTLPPGYFSAVAEFIDAQTAGRPPPRRHAGC